jgi:predicted protein tyrosine phosphatase
MSLHIDKKFLSLVAPKLQQFKQKKSDLWNFRCPYCLDSQKNKFKTRGYVYRKNNDLFFKCFNCEESHTFYNFLNYLDPLLCKEYAVERFMNGDQGNHNYPKPVISSKPVFNTKEKLNLPTILELDDNHSTKQYCIDRKFPQESLKDLYYTSDFANFVKEYYPEYDKYIPENDERLVIPFRNDRSKIFCVQGRTLQNSNMRYITIKPNEEVKLFGMDRLKPFDTVYVVEAPLDSLFLDNCIATADSNLEISCRHLKSKNIILIPDREPRNKSIVRNIQKWIKNNRKVCLLPDSLEGKDINEFVINGLTKEDLQSIILQNTFVGIRAELEFSNWKKI